MWRFGGACVGLALAISPNFALAGEWKTITADEARIQFTGIDGARSEFATAWNDGWTAEFTFGEWISRYETYPRAGLILEELIPYRLFRGRAAPVARNLNAFFAFLDDKTITLRDNKKHKGVDYWRFDIPGAECIALRKYFGETNIGASHGAGTKVYFGYYCDTGLGAVEPILDAITVRR